MLSAEERDAVQTHLDHGQTRILDTAGHFKLAIILFNLRDRWCASRWREGRRRVRDTRVAHTWFLFKPEQTALTVFAYVLADLMSPPVRLVDVKFSTRSNFQRGNLCFPSFLRFTKVEPASTEASRSKSARFFLSSYPELFCFCRTKLSALLRLRSPSRVQVGRSSSTVGGLYPRDFDVIGKENL